MSFCQRHNAIANNVSQGQIRLRRILLDAVRGLATEASVNWDLPSLSSGVWGWSDMIQKILRHVFINRLSDHRPGNQHGQGCVHKTKRAKQVVPGSNLFMDRF